MADEEKAQQHFEDDRKDIDTKAPDNTVLDSDSADLDIDLETYGEEFGYPLDVEVLKTITPKWQQYQLARDGRTVLIPQPSHDPNDPLTWTWKKKHILLFVIAAAAFLPDYGSATGAVTLIPQAV